MRALVLGLLLALAEGCYHYRVAMTREATPATEPQSVTSWAFFWGLLQTNVDPTNCRSNALHEITVTTNLGYAALTVISLGIVAPAEVEWRCATDKPTAAPNM